MTTDLMFLRLLLLLTIVPLTELLLLLRLAEAISWQSTLVLVVLTGILGAWLARRQGLRTIARIQEELARGALPADALVDAALILAAGLVLVTPGILTDLCGFALLVPPVRRWIKGRVVEAFRKRTIIIRGDSGDDFIDVAASTSSDDQPADDHRLDD